MPPPNVDSWYIKGDGKTCNISPLQVLQALQVMGAPSRKISSVKTKSNMCHHITTALSRKCLKNWKFKAFLGSGTYGSAFSVTNANGVVRVAKIVHENPAPEVRAQKRLSSIGVAPKLYDWCKISHGVWVLIMEKVDGSLQDLVGGQKSLGKTKLSNIFKGIVKNVEIMEKNNVSHGDLSLDNIGYVSRPDGTIRILLIDFGWSAKHVPVFDMASLAQSLLFTRNEVNRDFLYDKTRSYIWKKHKMRIPESTAGFDRLFKDFQKDFVTNLRKTL